MSAPAFAWAFERGHELGLTSSQLLLLLYMADQSNCSGSFYTGQPRMVKYTRLSVRTVRDQIPQLEALGLIQVMATPGKPTLYHLLMQPVGEATTAAPANGAGRADGAALTPATTAGHPGNLRRQPRQNLHATPATTAADPLGTQEEDPKTRVRAQEGEGFQSLNHPSVAPQPEPSPPKAPTIGTTPGGSGNYRPPSAHAVYADPDEARASFQAYLDRKRAEAHPEPAHDETPEPPADRTAVRRAAAATIYQLRKYAPAPGAKPERSRSEQIDAITHPTTNVVGEILPPIRRGPLEPVRTVAEQLAALGYPQMAEAAP
jgi:hypothetical protein